MTDNSGFKGTPDEARPEKKPCEAFTSETAMERPARRAAAMRTTKRANTSRETTVRREVKQACPNPWETKPGNQDAM